MNPLAAPALRTVAMFRSLCPASDELGSVDTGEMPMLITDAPATYILAALSFTTPQEHPWTCLSTLTPQPECRKLRQITLKKANDAGSCQTLCYDMIHKPLRALAPER